LLVTIQLASEAATNPEEVRRKLKPDGDLGDNSQEKAQFPYQVGDVCLVTATKDEELIKPEYLKPSCWTVWRQNI
jgi:hypothetical protein